MHDFYQADILNSPILTGDEFKHCVKVLRNKVGDSIGVFDGKGHYFVTRITSANKNQCDLEIIEQKEIPKKPFAIHLAIAPTKNMDRMEWMVEKLSEIGVDEITFIHTQHAERPKLKMERLEKKAISALKQSKSGYLINLNPLIRFNDFIKKSKSFKHVKCMAVVSADLSYMSQLIKPKDPVLILIGPEGDFSQNEIDLAVGQGFKLVSLGNNTLRTETAGLIAVHIVNVVNYS